MDATPHCTPAFSMYIYVYTQVYTRIYLCNHIHIYIERERYDGLGCIHSFGFEVKGLGLYIPGSSISPYVTLKPKAPDAAALNSKPP